MTWSVLSVKWLIMIFWQWPPALRSEGNYNVSKTDACLPCLLPIWANRIVMPQKCEVLVTVICLFIIGRKWNILLAHKCVCLWMLHHSLRVFTIHPTWAVWGTKGFWWCLAHEAALPVCEAWLISRPSQALRPGPLGSLGKGKLNGMHYRQIVALRCFPSLGEKTT